MRKNKAKSLLEYSSCIIQPGYLAVCQEPTLIGVVCGNGVVVCLRDKIKKIGGVAHYVYPKTQSQQRPSNYHAKIAIKSLVRCILDHNGYIRNFEALLFGGGHLRGHAQKRAEQTIRRTKKILKKMNITIVSEDFGGSMGRKIIFNTYSGETVVLKTRDVRKTDWAPEIECR